ncbi:MAG: ATP-grasp domain-containing protein [Candidatus Brocadiaceae bacterium]|nr:ATP-grasp domain-containing protein [Candidatus Brocadiaceae bacterium]
MKDFNILFTSSGRRVSLLRYFKEALQKLGVNGKVISADLQKNAPASFVADDREMVPRVTDQAYVPELLNICHRHDIRLLIPLIDTELHLLAPHRKAFDDIGVTLLVSSEEVNSLSLDKRKTREFFIAAGVMTPEILDPEVILTSQSPAYPYLLKPAQGSCSAGVTKVRNKKELEFFLEYIPNPIVQELVKGEEYTLDILVDFEGKVRCIVPRLRIETRAGEVSKGITVKHPGIIAAGRKVAEALPGALGCITVQCFLTELNDISFIEINPRFGGGYPLSFAAGADFPRWIIQMVLGEDPDITLDGWQDGLVMLRYDEGIFVDKKDIL